MLFSSPTLAELISPVMFGAQICVKASPCDTRQRNHCKKPHCWIQMMPQWLQLYVHLETSVTGCPVLSALHLNPGALQLPHGPVGTLSQLAIPPLMVCQPPVACAPVGATHDPERFHSFLTDHWRICTIMNCRAHSTWAWGTLDQSKKLGYVHDIMFMWYPM